MTTQVKVLTASDKAIKAMGAAASSLEASMSIASAALPELLVAIEEKQSELAQLTQSTDDATRRSKVELELRVAENEDKVLADLLKKRGLALITVAEVEDMKTTIVKMEENMASDIASAIATASEKMSADHSLEISKLNSEHSVATAEANAKIGALQDKVSHLETGLINARDDLNAERQARVAIAEAEAGRQPVVVQQPRS